jgi:hypothetical protein
MDKQLVQLVTEGHRLIPVDILNRAVWARVPIVAGIVLHDSLPLSLCHRVLTQPETTAKGRRKLIFVFRDPTWFILRTAHHKGTWGNPQHHELHNISRQCFQRYGNQVL